MVTNGVRGDAEAVLSPQDEANFETVLVSLFAVDEVVGRIKDGTIGDYLYDVGKAELALRNEPGER